MKRFGIWLILVLVGVVSANTCKNVSAEKYEYSTIEYATILNLAGRQRMLTQKMSKEILLIAWNVDVDKNKEELKKSSTAFEQTLNGLTNGDKGLGLPPAANPDIKERLNNAKPLWNSFKTLVDEVAAAGQTSESIIKRVSDLNLPLLDACDDVVTVYEVEAEQVTGGEARIINLSGRQRMLTQKMTKEFLLTTLNVNSEENKLRLKHTLHLFEQTLNGLIKGDKYLKLQRTTNKDIIKKLEKVQALWRDFREPIDTALNTGKWSQDSIRKVASLNVPLLVEMHEAVNMYEREYHPTLVTVRDAWITY